MRIQRLMMLIAGLIPLSAIAASDGDTQSPFSGELALGSLSGQTRERVYDPESGGRKVSQLNWKFNNAAVIKGAVNWDILPRVSFGASGWTTLASKGGYMDDTDWMDEGRSDPTDQSRHPDTRLNYANAFDFSLTGWLLNTPSGRLGIMAGYQESRYSFKSAGGTYDYTDEDTGMSDTGTFTAGVPVIGYKQRFRVPYVGVTGLYQYERFTFSGTFKYSGWVRADDSDEHYLTSTTFRDRTQNQNFYSLSGRASYTLVPGIDVYLEGIWNRTTNQRGSLAANNYDNGEKQYVPGGSGIENYNFLTMAGMKYTF